MGIAQRQRNVTGERLFMRNEDAGRRVVVSAIKTGNRPGTEANEQLRKKSELEILALVTPTVVSFC